MKAAGTASPIHHEQARLRAWVLVSIALCGVSLSAPVVGASAVPGLAIAFWRTAMGTAATVPWVLLRRRRGRGSHRRPTVRALRRSGVAGLFLAVHFALWLPSLSYTSVAAATALVCTTPAWTAILDRLRGVPVSRRVVLGVVVSLVGMVAITGADAWRAGDALVGDLLALGGGVAAAAYIVAGERVRQEVSTASYTLVCYGTCAAALLPLCLLLDVDLSGYDARGWLDLAVVTVSAQLLGHSLMNAAVPVVGATPLSLAILLEVPGAVVLGWILFGQVPPATIVPGTALVLAGLVVVVRARNRLTTVEADPPAVPDLPDDAGRPARETP